MQFNDEEYLQLEHVIYLVREQGYSFDRAVTVTFGLFGLDQETIHKKKYYIANALRINEKR